MFGHEFLLRDTWWLGGNLLRLPLVLGGCLVGMTRPWLLRISGSCVFYYWPFISRRFCQGLGVWRGRGGTIIVIPVMKDVTRQGNGREEKEFLRIQIPGNEFDDQYRTVRTFYEAPVSLSLCVCVCL